MLLHFVNLQPIPTDKILLFPRYGYNNSLSCEKKWHTHTQHPLLQDNTLFEALRSKFRMCLHKYVRTLFISSLHCFCSSSWMHSGLLFYSYHREWSVIWLLPFALDPHCIGWASTRISWYLSSFSSFSILSIPSSLFCTCTRHMHSNIHTFRLWASTKCTS